MKNNLTTIAQFPRTGAGCAAALKAEVPKAQKPENKGWDFVAVDFKVMSAEVRAQIVGQITASMRRARLGSRDCL